jgi:membrane protease YdiL (CAAX protease family)
MSANVLFSESRRDGRWIAVFIATMVVGTVVALAGALLVGHSIHRHYYDSVQLSILVSVRDTAALAVVAFAAPRYLRATPADLGIRYPRFRDIALGVLIALVFVEVITRLIVTVFPERTLEPVYGALARGTLPWRLVALFVIAIYSPITEEVVFRGLLLTSLVRPIGAPAAVVASSAIFAMVHAASGLTSVLNAFAFGIVMSILFLRSRSLTAPIAAHIATNFGITAAYIVMLGQAGR